MEAEKEGKKSNFVIIYAHLALIYLVFSEESGREKRIYIFTTAISNIRTLMIMTMEWNWNTEYIHNEINIRFFICAKPIFLCSLYVIILNDSNNSCTPRLSYLHFFCDPSREKKTEGLMKVC